jgi:hypothetical protein
MKQMRLILGLVACALCLICQAGLGRTQPLGTPPVPDGIAKSTATASDLSALDPATAQQSIGPLPILESPWARLQLIKLFSYKRSGLATTDFGRKVELLTSRYGLAPDVLWDLHRMARVHAAFLAAKTDANDLETAGKRSVRDWMTGTWRLLLTVQYADLSSSFYRDFWELIQNYPPSDLAPAVLENAPLSVLESEYDSLVAPSAYPRFILAENWFESISVSRARRYIRCVEELVELPEALTPQARKIEQQLIRLTIDPSERPWAFRTALLQIEVLNRLSDSLAQLDQEVADMKQWVDADIFESDTQFSPENRPLSLRRTFYTARVSAFQESLRTWWRICWGIEEEVFFSDLFEPNRK